MSNDYYTNNNTLVPGSTARAEDVTSELNAIESGFGKLPTPRDDGQGFTQPIKVGEAVDDDHCATRGQLTTLEAQAADSATTANQHKNDAETALTATQTARDAGLAAQTAAETAQTNTETARDAGLVAQTAAEAARDKAQEWAETAEDTEVETGEYSAKHWAKKAEQTVVGAKVFQGTWDASGGTYPSNPQTGYFWTIVVAGTINTVNFELGDELIYNGSTWDRVPNASAVTSVNSQVGDVTLTNTDVGAAATVHSHSDATTGASGYMSAADKTKLDGIEGGATADQTGAEIKAAYESEANTNAFTDAEKTKLGGIEANATADMSATEILNALLTVDGAASGLDAQYVGGISFTAIQQNTDNIDASRIINVPSSWLDNTWRPVSDSVASADSTVSASSAAVKTAYDLANGKLGSGETAANANQLGGVAAANYARLDQSISFTNGIILNNFTQVGTGTIRFNDNRQLEFGDDFDAYLRYYHSASEVQLDMLAGAAAFTIRDSYALRFTFDKATGNFTAEGEVKANGFAPKTIASGHVDAGGGLQIIDGSGSESILDIDASAAEATWVTVGPTGSGATVIWDALDNLSANAKSVLVTFLSSCGADGTSTQQNASIHAVQGGVTTPVASNNCLVLSSSWNYGVAGQPAKGFNTCLVPVDSNGMFKFRWSSSFSTTSLTANYKGFQI